MNYIDFIIILVVIIGAIRGSMKGLICQLGSLGGLVIGVILSRVFGGLFSLIFQSIFDMPPYVSDILSHTLVFLIVYVACIQLVKLVRQLANAIAMGWLDRLAGTLFGAVQYLFALSLLLSLGSIIDPSGELLPQEDLNESKYYERTLLFAPTAFSIAEERWAAENKETADLFIPCVESNDALWCC